jgi:hypothetical protein
VGVVREGPAVGHCDVLEAHLEMKKKGG